MARDPIPRGLEGGGARPTGPSRRIAGAALLAVFVLFFTLFALFTLVAPALLLAAPEGGEAGTAGHKGEFLVPPNVWAIVSFLLVLAILVWKLIPQIVHVMDRRAEAIREALEAAKKAWAQREALVATHAEEIRRSREETQALIAAGKAEALRVREAMVAAARQEAEQIVERSRREIQLAKESAIDDLQKRAVELAFDLSERLIRKSLHPAEHQDLIQESVRRLPRA